jgi:hypothetical protein
MEPSPRILGIDVSTFDVHFDRGAISFAETSYQKDSRTVQSGCKAYMNLPQDHVEWQQRQAYSESMRGEEERLWELEDRYNTRALQLASVEATKLRQARRRQNEAAESKQEVLQITEKHPMLTITQDYWLQASKAAAVAHAKGSSECRSARGLWQVPPERPMTQGRSVANCGGKAFRGDSGLQALACRHIDLELWEVKTATPAHLCGPRPCFSADSVPPRLDILP